jgi:hypothetical protein
MPRRGGWRTALTLALSSAAILVAAGVWQALEHDRRRADIAATAAQSPAAAAGAIARRFGAPEAVCHPAEPRDDIDNLISALFALERFAVSPFEATVEGLAVRATRLGLTPPDWSYGPGQIRLSRALSLSAGADGTRPRPEAVAAALLEPCAARRVARRLIATARGGAVTEADEGVLGRTEIIRLAAAYNAQAAPADATAALAHSLFNQIAYHLTLHYRYESAGNVAAQIGTFVAWSDGRAEAVRETKCAADGALHAKTFSK